MRSGQYNKNKLYGNDACAGNCLRNLAKMDECRVRHHLQWFLILLE